MENLRNNEKVLQNKIQSLQDASEALRKEKHDAVVEAQQAVCSLEEEVANLKREYFYATALGVKLNLSFKSSTHNVEIQNLFETAQSDGIPTDKWPKWIANKINAERQ